jgi:hypothetical protein
LLRKTILLDKMQAPSSPNNWKPMYGVATKRFASATVLYVLLPHSTRRRDTATLPKNLCSTRITQLKFCSLLG